MSTRVSNRLRAKRFKAGTATAEDKAYLEAKYDNLVKPSENITALKQKAQAKFEEDMSKVVLERERCETLMKEAIEVKKPTLIIEEDDDNEVVEETFTQNDAIYLNSLIRDRTNKMRNLMSLDEEIERLEKKRANHVSKKCVEMTPERFRNALFELGYIKK
jgi:hypothetical protein